MRWFKCLDINHKLIVQTRKAIGDAGAFQVIAIVSEAVKQDESQLDVEQVARWGHLKRDRAAKILPFAQKILLETLKIYGKTVANVEQIISKSEDFDTSNPGGSIKEEENRKIRKESSSPIIPPKENEEGGVGKLSKPPSKTDGVYFTIKRGFEHISEEDWLRRQLIEDIRYKERKEVDDNISLAGLKLMYHGVNKRLFHWLAHPLPNRMAAFAVAAVRPNVTGELSYATTVLDKKTPEFMLKVEIMTKAVEANDYEVEV